MKTILLGFGDINGKGKSTVLAGPDVPITDQIRQITEIKTSGEYPKGVVRVEFCELVSRNIGVCTSAAVKVAANNAAGEAERVAAAKKKDVGSQKATALQQAKKAVSDAAVIRNKAISAKHAANLNLAAAQNALKADDTKANKDAVSEANEAVSAAEKKLGSAIDKLRAAQQALADLNASK